MANILIVDDEAPIRELFWMILDSKGHDCDMAPNAQEARKALGKKTYDLVISDINMPGESGLDLIRHVRSEFEDTAVIMISAIDDPVVAGAALDMGIYEYVIKPINTNGVLISVASALRRRELEAVDKRYRQELETNVAERTATLQETMEKLRRSLDGIVHVIALTVESRDPYTAGHQKRVAELAHAICVEMQMPPQMAEGIQMAGAFHDLGKISVPAEILSKPGRLTVNEFNLIKEHPQTGYKILKDIEFPWDIARAVLHHHERMDGSGYPDGLAGEEIRIEARILIVADVVEAISSHRPYRPALGIEVALEEILKNRGTFYDPDVVDVCLKLFREKDFSFS